MIPATHHKKPSLEGPRLCKKCGSVYRKVYGMSNAHCTKCISKAKYYKNQEKLQKYSKERSRVERLMNHDVVLAREAKRRLTRNTLWEKYGITEADYARMLSAQGGKCAICPNVCSFKAKNSKRELYVDHDHITGKVRGLLCNHCNAGLGQFKDNISSLEKAIAYLRKTR